MRTCFITNAIVAVDRVPGPTACTAAARMLATYPGRTESPTEGEPMSRLIGYSALLAAATLAIIEIVIG